MARIKGIDIPNEKRVEIALTYIYGIGRSLSNTILKDANVDKNKKAKDLTEEEMRRITILIKYKGYIVKTLRQVEKVKNMEERYVYLVEAWKTTLIYQSKVDILMPKML